jgi:TonB family protein
VIASEEDGTLEALKFSLASDIVELVVLTADDIFLQTLREAVGGARRLWHVPSADKVSDLLVAGQVGILVLDVQTLQEAAPATFIVQIKRQFPDLVVVVAGNRDAEVWLAPLISAGTVYRFIHKPMSPGRAKYFADAAVKKFSEQRRRAVEAPAVRPRERPPRGWWILAGVGMLLLAAAILWAVRSSAPDDAGMEAPAAVSRGAAAETALLSRADAALAANHLTEPAGDNALELYRQAVAQYPKNKAARAGVVEVHERLLARAENALLEERLDEASAAIDAARRAGVENGRIAFLTSQLAKARERVGSAQAQVRARSIEPKVGQPRVTPLLDLVAQRETSGHLIEPADDSARFYLGQALEMDPNNELVQDATRELSLRLLNEIHGAIDRRDFEHATAWLNAARGIASAANVDAAADLLATARQQAAADSAAQLLKNANERLQQDRLIDPVNDSAKYFLLTLRSLDPNYAGLAPALSDLGARLTAKARRALTLGQYEAARSWLEEAGALGFASADATAVRQDLDAALAKQNFYANVVAANDLTALKTVEPAYPLKARAAATEGWVELDFTVTESGFVKDIAVHAVSTPGVFEQAAIAALAQWHYKPILRDSQPVPQRARVRIRFTLAG